MKVLLWTLGAAWAADLVLRDVHVVDADGPRDVPAVVIQDGRIISFDPADGEGFPVLELAGATVIPGLFDAHVHLSQIPGEALREDSPEDHEALVRHALRSYLACGVTGVLDLGGTLDGMVRLRATLDEVPGPVVWFAGPLLSPAGGYPASVVPGFPEVGAPEEVAPLIDAYTAAGHVVGIKLTLEQGFVGHPWPLYTDAVREAIRAEAARRGLPLFIHAMSPHERALALDLEPLALVHGPEHPSGVHRRTARQGVTVISTLSVVDAFLLGFELDRLDEPLYGSLSAIERSTATDPEAIARYEEALAAAMLPHSPGLRRAAMSVAWKRGVIAGRLARAERAILQLHRAGVPVVLGSDSGSWPVIPYGFHGPTTVRELELLVEAGLSPLEALTAATRAPAQLLGLADQGDVAVGMWADLVVLDADPLEALETLETPRLVIRNGVARSPAEWLSGEER